jgi:hypothetical protein
LTCEKRPEEETALADDRKTEEPFLQRWARRKADAAKPAAEQAPSETPGPETPGVDTKTTQTASLPQTPEAQPADKRSETEEIDLSTLPDIESLDVDSDFSVFMQNGVPEALQQRALQKLWRLDPAFGHIDGLLEYGEDFTGGGLVAEAVNTIYKVGKGMRTDEEEKAESEAAEDVAAAGAEDAAEDVAEAETDAATDRPATSQAGPTGNTHDPRNESVESAEPDRVARRSDPHQDR